MNHVTKNYWRSFMSEKIQVLGISVEKCYVDEVMDNINENWNRDDVLATYGVINMKILLAAQKDEERKEYIDSLDKGVVDEPEVLEAAKAERAAGKQIMLLNMKKNKKFQKEQLQQQGYEEIVEVFNR